MFSIGETLITIMLAITNIETGEVNEVPYNNYEDCFRSAYIVAATSKTHDAKCIFTMKDISEELKTDE